MSGAPRVEMSGRVTATKAGGLASIHAMAQRLGLPGAIDGALQLLERHQPYHESDHVLSLAYSMVAGGTCLQDLDLLRQDEALLNMLGARRLPDPTTSGDFLRRFMAADIGALQAALNDIRVGIWKQTGFVWPVGRHRCRRDRRRNDGREEGGSRLQLPQEAENLIDQLKHGVKALNLPVHDLISNWAYMVIAALAWTLKAWFGLTRRRAEDRHAVVRMEFRRFLNSIVLIPAQVLRSGRRVIVRLLAYTDMVRLVFTSMKATRALA